MSKKSMKKRHKENILSKNAKNNNVLHMTTDESFRFGGNVCEAVETVLAEETAKSEEVTETETADNVSGKETVSVENAEPQLHIIGSGESVFEQSLKSLTQADIMETELNSTKKKKQDALIRNVMLIVCSAVFLFSGYNLVNKMIQYGQAAEDNDELRSLFYEGETHGEATTEKGEFTQLARSTKNNSSVELLKKMEMVEKDELETENVNTDSYEVSEGISEIDAVKNSMLSLTAINSETYGWIRVSETNIDYPVVQAKDNEFYLDHNFNKVPQPSGAIFTDYRNSRDVLDNKNTIMYGHNMNDNTMFQALLRLRRDKRLFENCVVEVKTMDGIFRYEVFATYKAAKTAPYIQTHFDSDEQWVEFLYKLESNSTYHKEGIEFTAEDRIITLSTCSNTWDDGRIAVHARLIEKIQE